MEVAIQQLYVPYCIEVGRYTHQRPQAVPRKNNQIMTEPLCPWTVATWHAGIHDFMALMPYSQPLARRAARWQAMSNGTLVGRRLPKW
ncbi:hypothetical protein TNCV_578511 [Trichonephila clavipes]|nr:hypothetical protein TNCV_578511 [Trichonephila clavipes]